MTSHEIARELHLNIKQQLAQLVDGDKQAVLKVLTAYLNLQLAKCDSDVEIQE
jgi:hypothetical protein